MSEFISKVVMLGNPAVGKTSLVNQFVNNMFDDKYITTIGAKPSKKVMKIGKDTITMMLWDIAGHNYKLHPTYYVGAKGAILVCDLTNRDTLDSLPYWQNSLKLKTKDVPVKVLANKSDLFDWSFEEKDIEGLGFEPLLTSAKTGDNVEAAFKGMAENIINGKRQ